MVWKAQSYEGKLVSHTEVVAKPLEKWEMWLFYEVDKGKLSTKDPLPQLKVLNARDGSNKEKLASFVMITGKEEGCSSSESLSTLFKTFFRAAFP